MSWKDFTAVKNLAFPGPTESSFPFGIFHQEENKEQTLQNETSKRFFLPSKFIQVYIRMDFKFKC